MMVFMQNPPPIQLGARFTKSSTRCTLQSPNTDELYRVRADARSEDARADDLRDVNSDLQITNPQVNVEIDRDKARLARRHRRRRSRTRFIDAYGSRQISTIYAPNDEYWVEMELEPQYQDDPDA